MVDMFSMAMALSACIMGSTENGESCNYMDPVYSKDGRDFNLFLEEDEEDEDEDD